MINLSLTLNCHKIKINKIIFYVKSSYWFYNFTKVRTSWTKQKKWIRRAAKNRTNWLLKGGSSDLLMWLRFMSQGCLLLPEATEPQLLDIDWLSPRKGKTSMHQKNHQKWQLPLQFLRTESLKIKIKLTLDTSVSP